MYEKKFLSTQKKKSFFERTIQEIRLFFRKKVVIDASICSLANFNTIWTSIYEKRKIVLTTVTMRELEKLQKFAEDKQSAHARFILRKALEEIDNFSFKVINETFASNNENIINYCRHHRKTVILLTADKWMSVDAKARGINVIYLSHSLGGSETDSECKENSFSEMTNEDYVNLEEKQENPTEKLKETTTLEKKEVLQEEPPKEVVTTFYPLKNIKQNNMFLPYMHGQKSSYFVSVNGKQYSDRSAELKLGYYILVVKKKEDGNLLLDEYKITAIRRENNAQRIYCASFEDWNSEEIPEKYLSCIKEFVMRERIRKNLNI